MDINSSTGHDIIYVGNPFKSDNRTSSHHIARQLSRSHRLFYVEAGGLRAPRVNAKDLSRIYKRFMTLFKSIEEVEPNIHVKSIFSVPFGRFSIIRRMNRALQRRAIRKIIDGFGIQHPIVWCVSPALVEILSEIDASLTVYYCVDDFSAFPDVDVELVKKLDAEMTDKSDLLFTPSLPLYEKKKPLARSVHLSPHGVDVEHFLLAQDKVDRPSDLPEGFGRLAGFWGLIEHWIDLDLIFECAKAFPDVGFVMIGRVAVDLEEMDVPDNVFFLGAVSYEMLPRYASFFEALLIPYKDNDQVFNANPLKLREYLATGKPIVSVSNPEIDKYKDVVEIAKDSQAFTQLLGRCLENEVSSTVAQRLESVANESWAARYKAIMKRVTASLDNQFKNKE